MIEDIAQAAHRFADREGWRHAQPGMSIHRHESPYTLLDRFMGCQTQWSWEDAEGNMGERLEDAMFRTYEDKLLALSRD